MKEISTKQVGSTQWQFKRSPLSIGVLLAVATLNANAQGYSSTLEEVIVTSQKRQQTLQEVPISVNVVSGEKMANSGIERIEDLQSYVPNLTMSETGVGNNIYIRGIGSGINPGFEQSSAMFVDGVHFGRSQLYRAPMFDMERVEVLRGPQSTLFGKNAIAGAINMTTAAPTEEFEGRITGLYEPDHGERELTAVLSGGIGNVSARLALRDYRLDGYVRNTFLNRDEPSKDEFTGRLTVQWDVLDSLTAKIKYERNDFDVDGRQVEIISDAFSGHLPAGTSSNPGISYAAVLNSLGAQGVGDGTQDFARNSNGDFSYNSSDNITLNVDYEIGDMTLTSVMGLLSYDSNELCDCDFTSASIFNAPLEEEFDQFSQELRLTSAGDEFIDWIVGVHYQSNDLQAVDKIQVPSDSILRAVVTDGITRRQLAAGDSLAVAQATGAGAAALFVDNVGRREFNQDNESLAIFGDMTVNFTDQTRLSLGLRYSEEEKDATRDFVALDGNGNAFGSSVADQTRVATLVSLYAGIFGAQLSGSPLTSHDLSASRKDDSFDFSVKLSHELNDSVSLYGSVSTGFKAGGFDSRSNTVPGASMDPGLNSQNVSVGDGTFEFEDEKALSYELGSKMRFSDNIELNTAVFLTEYDDLQISIFDGRLGFNVGNAASATIQGIELDGRWQINEYIGMFGALAFLDFEYDSFENGQCYIGEQGAVIQGGREFCDKTGETNQYVADYSGAIGFDGQFPMGDYYTLNAGIDVTFSDDFITAQNNDPATQQDSYAKINARIALAGADSSWEIALLGRNLTDERVVPYTNPTPLSGSFNVKSEYGFVERPRSVALQGSFKF